MNDDVLLWNSSLAGPTTSVRLVLLCFPLFERCDPVGWRLIVIRARPISNMV
jgi:hypothetical protein